MSFILQKIILFILLPPSIILLLMAIGLFLLKRYPRMGKAFLFAAFLSFYLLSIEPVSDILLKPLEKSAPPLNVKSLEADAIVVLGGGAIDLSWIGLKQDASDTSLKRVVYAITLYKKFKIPLVITGGSGDPAMPDVYEADAMARVAATMGIPAKDIIIENGSRNTLESADVIAKLMGKKKRILLITSAFHMKRASAMFKKFGFEVIPAPCDYKSEQNKLTFYSFIPHAGNMKDSSTALYEYMSLLWYKMIGKI